jgi:hypothetical protein
MGIPYNFATMPNLADLKGEKILIHLLYPLLESKTNVLTIRLIDVESAGLWLEGSHFADYAEEKYKQPATKTPVFPVPFSQILWVLSSLDEPYLSEKSLGAPTP